MARPGPDSTLDEVRAKLIVAGTELLRERGVDLGLAEVPLADAITKAGVTRSTAYRSLAHDELAPQAVLHRALVDNLLTRYTQGEARDDIQADISAELADYADDIENGDVGARTRAMRAIIRVGANRSYVGAIDSPERSILTAMYGALRSSADESDWRRESLSEGERSLNEMFSALYEGLSTLFHHRLRAPFTMDQFTAAAASLLEGMAMRHGFNDELRTVERPTGPDGALESWTLFAIAFEAMFVGMFEPDDPDDPFADLTRY